MGEKEVKAVKEVIESGESNEPEDTMDSYSANNAKTQFGQLLMKAQRGPVQINKNNKPVAVLISMEKYEMIEQLILRIADLLEESDPAGNESSDFALESFLSKVKNAGKN